MHNRWHDSLCGATHALGLTVRRPRILRHVDRASSAGYAPRGSQVWCPRSIGRRRDVRGHRDVVGAVTADPPRRGGGGHRPAHHHPPGHRHRHGADRPAHHRPPRRQQARERDHRRHPMPGLGGPVGAPACAGYVVGRAPGGGAHRQHRRGGYDRRPVVGGVDGRPDPAVDARALHRSALARVPRQPPSLRRRLCRHPAFSAADRRPLGTAGGLGGGRPQSRGKHGHALSAGGSPEASGPA